MSVTSSLLLHVPKLRISVPQTPDLLLRQTLETGIALTLIPKSVLVLAVKEADRSEGEAEELEGEVDGVTHVELGRVSSEISPSGQGISVGILRRECM